MQASFEIRVMSLLICEIRAMSLLILRFWAMTLLPFEIIPLEICFDLFQKKKKKKRVEGY